MGGLKKKVGPLPMWAWILIVGVAGGLLWYEHDKSSSGSSSSSSTIDPATGLTYAAEQQDEAEGIDPLTGQSYASEQAEDSSAGSDLGAGSGGDYGGGTGLTDAAATSTPESLSDEISDVVGTIQTLQAAGLVPTASTASTAAATTSPSSSTAAKKKTFTDLIKGGVKITNTKPKATKTDTVKGIGNGLYEEIPKKQPAKKTTTKTTGSTKKKKVTTTKKK